ncbi:MAG TPA: translation elongation factor 4 [Spirochaetota bacterium]|nr:translation elongation factor 4 [Spirochaetota bacterium]HOS31899.1 translation elongation factor 4 [Spirochaetota bacterium]HOS54486.1 translation elongation factor 4 [Spirochaetota bacterium]HPY87423.1 translation elongation factor 4 [Spirochaetota bacterium]HQF76979.1 translation elongation factor 4 [Spirochaetota bacterium]
MLDRIRNFSIIAHIDHGKSTLADRLIEFSNIISQREYKDQILDNLDIERERGITIKSNAVRLPYTAKDGNQYSLNLIDTPGHVDFTYEVSRSLKACEGALLLIDATQGVEAQTLANLYLALELNLEIIIVINKIDLPSANVEEVKKQIKTELGLDPKNAILASGKEGIGIADIFEAIVNVIPPPEGKTDSPLKSLIFDSHYDEYRGVVIHTRVFDGEIKAGDEILLMQTGTNYVVEETGYFKLRMDKSDKLSPGDVGYVIAGIKNIADVLIGDTITNLKNPAPQPLAGFKEIKPVVFSSIYPVSSDDYQDLADALLKLKLNDSSLIYAKDFSSALGFGFRCGFLGLLHLEVVQERLEREFDVSLILTAPSVQYNIFLKSGDSVFLDNPLNYPDETEIDYIEEPYIKATIILPQEYLGSIMNLCIEKRGSQTNFRYLDEKRVELQYDLPLAEIIYDFYDKLKSMSKGYASFDYEITDMKRTDLAKVDILVSGKPVDALSFLVHKESARNRAKKICEKLTEHIPRQQFKIPIQAAIGNNIIARENINAYRKDVIAKCYGGDISRKRKLLEKQKEGKKRMKMVGNVEIPQSAFMAILKTDDV